MYQKIYQAYQVLSNGDKSELNRSNLKKIANLPAYFRVLKIAHVKDSPQTQRILFVMAKVRISEEAQAPTVARGLLDAGVKERQIMQIIRSGDNGIEYLKRQLLRCSIVQLDSLGKLAQYWGDNARRGLLKDFILSSDISIDKSSN